MAQKINPFKKYGGWLGGFTGLFFFLIMYFSTNKTTNVCNFQTVCPIPFPGYLIFAYLIVGFLIGWGLEELTLLIVKKEKIEL